MKLQLQPSTASPAYPAVYASMAAFPNFEHVEAVQCAAKLTEQGALRDPLLGVLSTSHVQLVPQNRGILTPEIAGQLQAQYPDIQFRLHANVRVLIDREIYDLSNFADTQNWFEAAGRISRSLGATAYSAHAGYRDFADLPTVLDNAKRAADIFGHPVAVEGLYPPLKRTNLHNMEVPPREQNLTTWQDYRTMLESNVPFALDLSHLNIVAKQHSCIDSNLMTELLSSEHCIEVHVSDNDGTADTHQVCNPARRPWWEPYLARTHRSARVFFEGNLRRHLGLKSSRSMS